MRDSFVFYRSFFEAFTELSQKDRLKLFDSLCEYALNDVEPKLSGAPLAVFKLLKPQVDANIRKYENGCKGGKPKRNQNETKAKPNANQNETKAEPNDNVNVNDNENENVNVSGSEPNTDDSFSLVSYLNSKTGSSYKETAPTMKLIQEIHKAGYSDDDIRSVIDKKCYEWGNSDMRSNLRPSVLFNLAKFEEYLHAPITLSFEKGRKQMAAKDSLKKEKAEKERALSAMRNRLGSISAKTDPDEWRSLKEQIAIAEDAIAVMDRELCKEA